MTQVRVDLHTAAGAKLDAFPLVGNDLIACSYTMAVSRLGTFSFQAPAEKALNATAGRQAWIYDAAGHLRFRGVIRSRDIAVDANGMAVATITGPSLGDQLNGLQTGRGLTYEDQTLSTVVTDLIDGTDFEAGELATATITARRFDDRTRLDAIASIAQSLNCSHREDLISATPAIDIGPFGDPCGITLRNVPALTPSLAANRYLAPLTAIKVKAQSLDLVNRVTPYGQIEGLGGLQFNLAQVSPANPDVTRLYIPSSGATPISPAYDSSWTNAPIARRPLSMSRQATPMATDTNSTTANSPAGWLQLIYGPLAQQTITGTVKAQVRAREASASDQMLHRVIIKVFDSTGTVLRGTLLAATVGANEYDPATLTNVTFPATALTEMDVEAGDYMVVEFGGYQAAALGVGNASWRAGDEASQDLPINNTETEDYNPWIEFSGFIALGADLPSGNAYEVLSATGPDGKAYYYIEDADSIAQHGVRERAVYFKDILPLGLTTFDFSQAAIALYGLAVDYLTKHLSEQTAYDVETFGLHHVDPDTGAVRFKVGDTFRVQADLAVQAEDGSRVPYLQVDEDLYLLDFTVTFTDSGAEQYRLTLATFLRALRTDGEILTQMARNLGIEQAAPIQIFTFIDGVARVTTDGQEMVATDSGDALASIPDGAGISWFKDSFTGTQVGEIGGGYATPGVNTFHNMVMRAIANADGANAKVGVWDKATGDWAMGLTVQDSPVAGDLVAIFKTAGGQASSTNYAIFTFSGTTDCTLTLLRGGTGHPVVIQGFGSTLTIATGVITVTEPFHTVDTEAAAATDNLDTINGGSLGMRVVFKAANSARDVVFTEAGNMKLAGGTFTLNNVEDTIELIYDGTNWLEIGRSDNGA